MQSLTIEALNALRLAILTTLNACSVRPSSSSSTACTAAHICLLTTALEELGKIPIIVGVIAKLRSGESMEWKNASRGADDAVLNQL